MTRCAATSFSLIKSLPALALAFLVGGAWQLDERKSSNAVCRAAWSERSSAASSEAAEAWEQAAVSAEADANARARAAYESEYYGEPPLPGGPGLVHDIQAFLVRLGYNPGPVDGVYGQRTADAISQYQYASRLSVDGRPSPQLLNFMISQGPGSGRAGHPDEHLGRQRRTMREASAKPAGCQSVS